MASNVGMCRNDKGRCINPIQRPQIWCGEGDLNPHEIAPASTSSLNVPFQGGQKRPKSLTSQMRPVRRGPERPAL